MEESSLPETALFNFLESIPATTRGATTDATMQLRDWRLEFNCQQGRHYGKIMKGSGNTRDYHYEGIAEVVASRGGYYGTRWREYQNRHRCNYVH